MYCSELDITREQDKSRNMWCWREMYDWKINEVSFEKVWEYKNIISVTLHMVAEGMEIIAVQSNLIQCIPPSLPGKYGF